MIRYIFITVLLYSVISLHAQNSSPKVYKGLGGEYTFEDFKEWSDSLECKEPAYVLKVTDLEHTRKIKENENDVRKAMKAIPLLIHVSEPSKKLVYNGYIKIYEGGANLYLFVTKQEYKKLKSLKPETVVYCSTLKRRLKANQTAVRFLAEKNMEELDPAVRDYLVKNSLIMLTAFAKDVIDCDNPTVIRVKP